MKKNSYLLIAVSFFLFIAFIPTVHAEESGQVYEVGTHNLTVREAPDHGSKIVGYLQSGDQVTVFKAKHGWVQTYYAGKTAWVASQYLYETDRMGKTDETTVAAPETITITTDSAHLRTEPSAKGDVAGFATKGDTFSLIDTKDNWIQIDTGNGTPAWVALWVTDEAARGDEPSDSKRATDQNTTSDSSKATADTSTDKSGNSSNESNSASNESVAATNEDTSSESETVSNEDDTTSSESEEASNLTGNLLEGYNIMLDAGHGGKDPGAIGFNGEEEAALALDITQMVAEKLRNEGATVLLTRSANTFVSLADRMRINDAYWTDAFISLHLNASTSENGNGVSTHYYEDGSDKQMAQSIQNALDTHTDMQNRGISQNNYHVLRENSADSVLVELGFITNPYDLEHIKDIQNTSGIADAIAEGLNNYLQ